VIEFNMNAKPADRETVTFDYGIPAELFMGKRKAGARPPLREQRLPIATASVGLIASIWVDVEATLHRLQVAIQFSVALRRSRLGCSN